MAGHGPHGIQHRGIVLAAQAAYRAFWLALFLSVALGLAGLLTLSPLFALMATPPEVSSSTPSAEPGAGLVYCFDTDATGTPAAPFRPISDWWAKVTR